MENGNGMTVTTLEAIKAMLEKEVCPTIRLQRNVQGPAEEYTLLHPTVTVGCLSQKGFSPVYSSPCIVVGLEKGMDGNGDGNGNGDEKGNGEQFRIRLSFLVFSPGQHQPDGTYFPNLEGYLDLLNLMDRTRTALRKKLHLNGKRLRLPIQFGMEEEQIYPYWYGWMTFSLEGEEREEPNEAVQTILRG